MTAPAKMLMRLETAADRAAIHALTTAAFAPMRFSDGTEADLVDLLREIGMLGANRSERLERLAGL